MWERMRWPRERGLAGPAGTGTDAGAIGSVVVLALGNMGSLGQHCLEEPELPRVGRGGGLP